MRGIPIDVLRAFVAVVEARGFTRAAEDLGRSQPTISLQVKRLEELVEAPLFEKAARFELTSVGAVCFDYGKRLLRLHDDMLDEAARRATPDPPLRVGIPSEFAALLTPRLGELRAGAKVPAVFDVITDPSQALVGHFRQNALDIALVAGQSDRDTLPVEQWRAPLRWYGGGGEAHAESRPLPLAIAPPGSPFHEAAIGALRAHGRKFDIVCMSADFAVARRRRRRGARRHGDDRRTRAARLEALRGQRLSALAPDRALSVGALPGVGDRGPPLGRERGRRRSSRFERRGVRGPDSRCTLSQFVTNGAARSWQHRAHRNRQSKRTRRRCETNSNVNRPRARRDRLARNERRAGNGAAGRIHAT